MGALPNSVTSWLCTQRRRNVVYMLDSYLQFRTSTGHALSYKSPVVIETDHLTRVFDKNVAVQELTLEVSSGEIFGFLGHNGAGKTTTVRLLNGLLDATSGSAQVLGLNPATQGPQLRQRTGVLTETPSLDNRLSAYENLAHYAAIYSLPKALARARINE